MAIALLQLHYCLGFSTAAKMTEQRDVMILSGRYQCDQREQSCRSSVAPVHSAPPRQRTLLPVAHVTATRDDEPSAHARGRKYAKVVALQKERVAQEAVA